MVGFQVSGTLWVDVRKQIRIIEKHRRKSPAEDSPWLCRRTIAKVTATESSAGFIHAVAPCSLDWELQHCTSPTETSIRGSNPGGASIIMQSFLYNAVPSQINFGKGTISHLPAEVARQNSVRPLLLSTLQQVKEAESLRQILDGNVAGMFTKTTMHTPTEIAQKTLEYAKVDPGE
ncbi:hypothetical protein BP5796_08262 [Coleophoma crateriformis]|uniref:Uncharacterized protein n=1 Tax=Coleophoma crateriformis TaxID=565419 RepID=A0A3D8RE81_9HELO|nr:hypothetical protein BP5796_08262 [Coleophoma crateriformis]